MSQPIVTFAYRPSLGIALFLLLVSTAFVAIGIWAGLTNEGQTDILGIPLSVRGTTIMYWCFTVFFFPGILVGIGLFRQRRAKSRLVVLTQTEISAPRGAFYKQIKTIAYADITKMRVLKIQRNTMLEIKSASETLVIQKNCVQPDAHFNALTTTLQKRVAAAGIRIRD